jgi:RimJ/RimL family protein N-acetyltransferase
MNAEAAMNLQPQLSGRLIRVEPLLATDFESLFLAASDPLIWEQHPNPLRYQREVFERFFEGALASKGAFVIRHTQTQAVIGSSRFYDFDPPQQCVFIGYTFLTRAHWGGPANREMKTLMLNHAFSSGVDTVCFHIGINNLRSRTSIERLGAVKTREETVRYFGEAPKLNAVYEMSRVRWASVQPS